MVDEHPVEVNGTAPPLPGLRVAGLVTVFALAVLLLQVFQDDPPRGPADQQGYDLTLSQPQSRAEVLVGRMDGKFYFEIAVDPSLQPLSENVNGDLAGAAFRASRPLTGWLAWLLSLGGIRPLIAPAMLALTALSLGGCVWAIQFAAGHRRVRWPAAALALPGMFVALISPGLSDQLAAGLAVAAVGAHRRRMPGLPILLLTAAILTRETTAVVAVAITLAELWRTRQGRALAYSAIPLAVFLAWNAVVHLLVGRWFVAASGGHADSPGMGLIDGMELWGPLEVVSAGALVVALVLLWTSRDAVLRWTSLGHLAMAFTMNAMVWKVWWGFSRVMLPAQLLAFLNLLHERPTDSPDEPDDDLVEGNAPDDVEDLSRSAQASEATSARPGGSDRRPRAAP